MLIFLIYILHRLKNAIKTCEEQKCNQNRSLKLISEAVPIVDGAPDDSL